MWVRNKRAVSIYPFVYVPGTSHSFLFLPVGDDDDDDDDDAAKWVTE